MINSDGMVLVVETTVANCHDSKSLLDLLDKAKIQSAGIYVYAVKSYIL
ncbi:hypothetical protein [Nitrosomonas sp.]|nr:hypothetical protein [Nitrosomonas sp.]MBX3616527.1 hypothetical protein [Nitrosomonas sp.]